MRPEEKQQAIDRYAARLAKLGPTAQALGWRDSAQQRLRFDVLASLARLQSGNSILDIGCGFADLYDYLREHDIDVEYTGCDLVPEVLAVARCRHDGLTLEQRDVLEQPYAKTSFDHVFISGIFNHHLRDNVEFLERMLRSAFETSRLSVCANMTTDRVDYRDEHLFYFAPADVLNSCLSLTRHVALRHDYPLYEFSVFLYRTAQ
jgi:SAM-dependent methyltransferase